MSLPTIRTINTMHKFSDNFAMEPGKSLKSKSQNQPSTPLIYY